jgi:hypothetical protein
MAPDLRIQADFDVLEAGLRTHAGRDLVTNRRVRAFAGESQVYRGFEPRVGGLDAPYPGNLAQGAADRRYFDGI